MYDFAILVTWLIEYATCSYPSLIRPRVRSSLCESTYTIISPHGCGGEGQRRTTEEMVRVFPPRASPNINVSKKGEGPKSGRGNVRSRLSRFVYLILLLCA